MEFKYLDKTNYIQYVTQYHIQKWITNHLLVWLVIKLGVKHFEKQIQNTNTCTMDVFKYLNTNTNTFVLQLSAFIAFTFKEVENRTIV